MRIIKTLFIIIGLILFSMSAFIISLGGIAIYRHLVIYNVNFSLCYLASSVFIFGMALYGILNSVKKE